LLVENTEIWFNIIRAIMKKRVVFVPITEPLKNDNNSVAAGYIVSYLQSDEFLFNKLDIKIINGVDRLKINIDDVICDIMNYKPDIICFSAYIWNYNLIKKIARKIKEIKGRIITIAGGPSANLLINEDSIDFIILGYGEETLANLLKQILGSERYWPDRIAVYDRSRGRKILSFPSPYKMGMIPNKRHIILQISRGCKNRCKYCNWGNIDNRIFSIKHIYDSLIWAADNGIRDIIWVDSYLNDDRNKIKYLLKIFKRLRRSIPFTQFGFYDYKRFNIDEIKMLKDMNFTVNGGLGIGLQSLNPKVLRYLGRNFSEYEFLKFLEKTEKYIKPTVILILGLPYDDPDNFINNLNFLSKLPVYISVYLLVCLPDSIIWKEQEKHNIIVDNKGIPYIVSSKYFSHSSLVECAKYYVTNINNKSGDADFDIKNPNFYRYEYNLWVPQKYYKNNLSI